MQPRVNLAVLAVGITILGFALLSVNFNIFQINSMRLSDYYYNYSLGYLNRGLVGSILHYLYGVPAEATIQAVVPQFNYYFMRVVVLLCWLLLFIPLVQLKTSTSLHWLLVAVAALLLLAPIWRYQNHYHHLDPYIFLCSLLALVALLKRRPLLMTLPLLVGTLVHPLMLLYLTLLGALVLHACMVNEHYVVLWRRWLLAFGLVVMGYLLASLVNDPARNLQLLTDYGYPYPADYAWLELDFFHTFTNASNYILAVWSMHTATQLWLVVLYLLIPTGLFVLLAHECSHEAGWQSVPLSHRLAQLPTTRWKLRYDKQLLVIAGMLWFAPTALVITDTYRMFLLGFWSVGIVLIYLLWGQVAKQAVFQELSKPRIIYRNCLTGLCVLLAYTFGGAPLVDFLEGRSAVHQCQKNCIAYVTDNPLGRFYTETVIASYSEKIYPIAMDSRTIQRHKFANLGFARHDDALIVPANTNDYLVNLIVPVNIEQPLRLTLNYASSTTPKLQLIFADSYAGVVLEPQLATPTTSVWEITPTATTQSSIRLIVASPQPLAVHNFLIEEVN